MIEDMIEVYPTKEIFVDGFAGHKSSDGVMTCVGYRKMSEGNVVVVRLAWPAVNTNEAIISAIDAMSAPPGANAVKSVKRDVH
jgi:hypothetical protein